MKMDIGRNTENVEIRCANIERSEKRDREREGCKLMRKRKYDGKRFLETKTGMERSYTAFWL